MAEARALKRMLKNLEKFKAQTAGFTADTRISEIKTYAALLADEWKEFQVLERSIKGKFDESNMNLVEAIEESHADLKQRLCRLEKQHEENNANLGNHTVEELILNQSNFLQEISSINKRESEVRLPRVNIQDFSGNYGDFPSFRDLFETSVHNNDRISKVHKLQYLKSLLKGDAYALIKHFTVTDANYEEAWNKIKARYDKSKHVVQTLLKRFLDQPSLQQGCAKSIRHLSDVSDEVIRGLKVLGDKAEGRDPWLIYILVNKLDSESKEAWAHETTGSDFPTLDELFAFLNKRSDALESLSSMQRSKAHASKRVSSLVSHVAKFTCLLCAGEHYLWKCDKYIQLPIPERKQLAAEKKLCFNCLSPSHQSVVCRSKYKCGKCQRKHHLTLHPEEQQGTNSEGTITGNILHISEAGAATDIGVNATTVPSFQSLLPTAIVEVADEYGNMQKCRVLLDSGSQASFITEACMQRLKLPRSKASISITGLTSGKVTTRGMASITANSVYFPMDRIQIDVLIISQLPNRLPSFDFTCKEVGFLSDLKLADPQYNQVGPVDILVGADRFFHVLRNGRLTNLSNTLVAQRTIFGWVISGITNESSVEPSEAVQVNNCTLNLHLDVDIDNTLKRFFEQEEMPRAHILDPEEAECEEHYKSTHKRNDDGRYIVAIPFKKKAAQLGNSVNAAKRRFLALERKLQVNPLLKEEYTKFINEYLNLGYLVPIKAADHAIDDSKCFYLPHHCVLKESSETTKLRVVFDGSAKSSTGIALNETMLVGPTIQPTLWAILMRFRNHKIALIGDIEKMYNQVLVCEEDTQFQRILWRSEVIDELKHYKLNTVTFGLASSSFLAIRTLHQIAYDNQQDYPDIAACILNDFYVDDFISGADTVEEVQHLKEKMNELLLAGGFKLRKWRSNVPDITVTENTDEISMFHNSATETKILGIKWNSLEDVFTFQLTLESSGEPTKRRIISEYSRVFDPLGWLSPSIILMKIVFQTLWLMKLGWDEQLPDHVASTYKKIRSELKFLECLKIKRYIPQEGRIELHGFSDASEKAYSAVVYCRTIHANGSVTVNLMASKTKVAPIKQVSLPRLELCGAQLLTKLLSLVKDTIKHPVKCYGWTDSTIVLMWLSSHPARWKTFVANRTSEILGQLPRNCWNHVRSEHNPADCASRGVFPSQLIDLKQWWHGPEWLKNPNCVFTFQDPIYGNGEALAEERKNTELFVLNAQREEHTIDLLICKTSRYTKLLRVFAYVLRFLENIRAPADNRISSCLTVKEIRTARDTILKHIQRESFAAEIDRLQRGKVIQKNSDILSLAPFIDANGILRVGGRLKHLDCQYDYKHPIILPKGHPLSQIIILHIHEQNLHPGLTLTFHLTRQQFWIVGGRNTIRKLVNKCVICFRNNAKTSKQLMGDLPIARMKATRPFTSCGVDYAGPIQIASKRGRGARLTKGYIALFICMVTKAIHIEAVSDLSTDAFIAALKRFVARRGAPANIYSDNGSNFVGAKRKLNEVYQLISHNNHNSIVAEYLAKSEVQWHFIPPASPHFGGLWEAAVKSVKTHLTKCTSSTHLTFEEMVTLLSQIESILNSRPLYATADDDAALDVLTPAHFLIGSANFYLPEKEISESVPVGRLTRWQYIQQRVQSFWKKFSIEYLHNLQQRAKWRRPQQNFNIGDIVLIKEENLPSYKWALGKIIQLHPDQQGRVRVVTLKTSASTLKRPIVKLCKLPKQDDSQMVNDGIVNGADNVADA